jgi:hypothetical protein
MVDFFDSSLFMIVLINTRFYTLLFNNLSTLLFLKLERLRHYFLNPRSAISLSC